MKAEKMFEGVQTHLSKTAKVEKIGNLVRVPIVRLVVKSTTLEGGNPEVSSGNTSPNSQRMTSSVALSPLELYLGRDKA
jgi:hypothetical protein